MRVIHRYTHSKDMKSGEFNVMLRYIYIYSLKICIVQSILSPNIYSDTSKISHRITVFIHGTIQAGICIFCNPRQTWKDSFTGSTWSERILSHIRHDVRTSKSDLMLDMGLVPIDAATLIYPFTKDCQHKAAFHTIAAFDTVNSYVSDNTMHTIKRHYYTFGWSGLLSEHARRDAAKQLYDLLNTLRKKWPYAEQPTFELHGHSHGGQLILHLPAIRAERNENDFIIDLITLSGTPLFYETARNIWRGMFRTVINIFSLGDQIQLCDIFSTPKRRSVRSFAELQIPFPQQNGAYCVIDLALIGETNPRLFGHGSFFTLDRYKHRNRHRIQRTLIETITPIPLVAFYPGLLHHFENTSPGYYQYNISLKRDPQQLTAIILGQETAIPLISYSALEEMVSNIKKAYARTSHLSELTKAMLGLKTLLSTSPYSKQKRANILCKHT